MPVTEQTFRNLALEDPESNWELHRGRLVEKPSTSYRHNFAMMYLGVQLVNQLDVEAFEVRVNSGRVRREHISYFIPDVFVIPTSYFGPERDRADVLEIYDRPLPLVAEIWSPSIGDYDIDSKLPEYRERGDGEIWRLHAFERHLNVWRRRVDGEYDEIVYEGGRVAVSTLPNVLIDLDALFD